MNAPAESTASSGDSLRTVHRAPSRTGRRVALALVVVWLLIIVALFVVLAKLKLGGAEALRTDRASQSNGTTSVTK